MRVIFFIPKNLDPHKLLQKSRKSLITPLYLFATLSMHHGSTIKKVAIIFVLLCFLLSTGLVSLLYLGGSNSQTDTGSQEAVPTNAPTATGEVDSIAPGSILNAFSTGN